jgi:hypothetical protein
MNKHQTLDRIVLTPQEEAAMEAIGAEALQTVDETYGTGYPHFFGGQQPLAYHNGHHTRAVLSGSERMATHLGLTRAEVLTAKEAGAAHDIVQLKPRGVMERESAEWYAEQLRQRRLPELAVQAGSLAILGTEPLFDDQFGLVGQRVSRLEFPSRSDEQVAGSVACADFSELYAPIGPYLSHRLWQQIKGARPSEESSIQGLAGYQKGQVILVNNYRYPHPAGEQVFGGLRGAVTRYHEDVLRQIEAGEIGSLQQLLDSDLQFAAKHS